MTSISAQNKYDLLAQASIYVCKYSSIIVLPEFDNALLYTLLTLRQNIYTDPQKPIQVEPKIYAVGEPTPQSPVFVTTNFSLTYFIVSGEIENSGISAHLVVCDCEGQSVLTAWAAGKFIGSTIAKFFKEIKLEDQVKTRKIVIPGLVSQISGDLEENMPDWEIIVGCQEASDIPSFVKNMKARVNRSKHWLKVHNAKAAKKKGLWGMAQKKGGSFDQEILFSDERAVAFGG